MHESKPGKTVADSKFDLSALMNPQHANPLGNVHGGVIMKLVDEAGGIVAMRHAGRPVVTVAIDSMTFLKPIIVGNLVICRGGITYAGTTSMEIRVEVFTENPYAGSQTRILTNTAYVVYVALNDQGKPERIPPLVLSTPEEQALAERAAARQAYRKQQRKLEEQHNP